MPWGRSGRTEIFTLGLASFSRSTCCFYLRCCGNSLRLSNRTHQRHGHLSACCASRSWPSQSCPGNISSSPLSSLKESLHSSWGLPMRLCDDDAVPFDQADGLRLELALISNVLTHTHIETPWKESTRWREVAIAAQSRGQTRAFRSLLRPATATATAPHAGGGEASGPMARRMSESLLAETAGPTCLARTWSITSAPPAQPWPIGER